MSDSTVFAVPDRTEPAAAEEPVLTGDGATDYRSIPLDEILPDPSQPRRQFDATSLAELAESIQTHGQLQPIVVYWDTGRAKYVILCGERRYRACRLAGRAAVEAKVVSDPAEQSAGRLAALAENLAREDLLPSELARAFQDQMQANGWTSTELAARLHISPSRVTKTLAVLTLSTSLQAAVDAGRLPLTIAYQLSRLEDPAEKHELADLVFQGKKTRSEVTAAVQQRLGKRKPPGKLRRIVLPVGPEVSVTLTTGTPLEWDKLLEGLGQFLHLAKKARTHGGTAWEELARLCGNLSTGKHPGQTLTGKSGHGTGNP